MPKSQIRPPSKPKGEPPEVTIANQACQIDNLIARIETLVKDRNEALKQIVRLSDEIRSHRMAGEALCDEMAELKEKLRNADTAIVRAMGWQDCAREVFSEMLSKS